MVISRRNVFSALAGFVGAVGSALALPTLRRAEAPSQERHPDSGSDLDSVFERTLIERLGWSRQLADGRNRLGYSFGWLGSSSTLVLTFTEHCEEKGSGMDWTVRVNPEGVWFDPYWGNPRYYDMSDRFECVSRTEVQSLYLAGSGPNGVCWAEEFLDARKDGSIVGSFLLRTSLRGAGLSTDQIEEKLAIDFAGIVMGRLEEYRQHWYYAPYEPDRSLASYGYPASHQTFWVCDSEGGGVSVEKLAYIWTRPELREAKQMFHTHFSN